MIFVHPDPWTDAPSVVVESDASTNAEAMRQIEDWAAENGFARTNEYWLRPIRREGRTLFQAVCYRLTEEHRAAGAEQIERIRRRTARMPAHVQRAEE